MKDLYGNEYTLFSGKTYICKKMNGYGNVSIFSKGKLIVLSYGKLSDEFVKNTILLSGFRKENWL